jgi:hypothetical protein
MKQLTVNVQSTGIILAITRVKMFQKGQVEGEKEGPTKDYIL